MLTDVIKLWDDLATESTATGKHLERLVRPESEVEVVLGYGAGRFDLDIAADFPLDWEKNLKMPHCMHCELDHTETTPRAKFRFRGDALDNIFVWFSQDVANRLDGASLLDAPEKLELAIVEWAEAFRIDPQKGMSRQAQQGLFAELFFLEEVLIPGLSSKALLGWHSQNSVHDFQVESTAWEVKSYGGRRMEVRISSEDQLDDIGLSPLILVAVCVKVSDEAGQSIDEIVERLIATFSAENALLSHFKTGLAKYGYIDRSSIIRKYFFTPRAISQYRVSNDFPRIVRTHIPSAVSNVNYLLSLTSLESHLIKPIREY